MIYSILFEADKHWGAAKPEEQYRSAYLLKRLLSDLKPHLFISLGDFYDTKLLLNSKSSVYALRDMHDKSEICKQLGIPMRVIRGTLSHDYDQLAAFSALEHDPKRNFKTFSQFTIEETLPKMEIAYCPDENISWAKFQEYYLGELISHRPAIAACHGDFDVILPQIAIDAKDGPDSTSLVFRYNDIIRHLDGPIISGHWHDCNEFEHLYYAGSSDRWIFGEDCQKGFILLRYDTEKKQYQLIRPHNFLEAKFKTFVVYTSLYHKPEEYQKLITAVEKALSENPNMKVRVKIHLNEDYGDTDTQIQNLKFHFNMDRRVSFFVQNEIKAKQKVEEKQAVEKLNEDYWFLRDKGMPVAKKIQTWIKRYSHHDYPLEVIESFVNPELQKG